MRPSSSSPWPERDRAEPPRRRPRDRGRRVGRRLRPDRDTLAGPRRRGRLPARSGHRLADRRLRPHRRGRDRGPAGPLRRSGPRRLPRRLVRGPDAPPRHRPRSAPPAGPHHPAPHPDSGDRLPERLQPARTGCVRARRGPGDRPPDAALPVPPVDPVRGRRDRDGRSEAPRERRPPVRARPDGRRGPRRGLPRRHRHRRPHRPPADHDAELHPVRAVPHPRGVLERARPVRLGVVAAPGGGW